jgi:hypothetical protein
MPALQHFNTDLEDGDETCADIFQAQNVLFYVLGKIRFVRYVLG